MKVLSLFDGISCGRVALERANIKVDRYVAYEIENSAIQIAQKNYSDIEEKGDVFKADFKIYKGFDLLIGGSPCTYWSIAQKVGARETTNSGLGWDLFSQYVRALNETEIPYFLYENNYSMNDSIKHEITKTFNKIMKERGITEQIVPVHINSALVSSQSRDRYYWTNIPCNGSNFLPKNKNINLQDILEFGYADRNKALCLARRYAGFGPATESYQCRRYFGKHFGTAIFKNKESRDEVFNLWKKNPYFDKGTDIEKDLSKRRIRQLTVKECERLQTLPDDYTLIPDLTSRKRIEAIGNGWTVDVIVHLLKGLERYKQPKKFIFGV